MIFFNILISLITIFSEAFGSCKFFFLYNPMTYLDKLSSNELVELFSNQNISIVKTFLCLFSQKIIKE